MKASGFHDLVTERRRLFCWLLPRRLCWVGYVVFGVFERNGFRSVESEGEPSGMVASWIVSVTALGRNDEEGSASAPALDSVGP